MKAQAKPRIRGWHLFGDRIVISRSALYGVHIQAGRWLIARETTKANEVRRSAVRKAAK